MSQPFNGSFHGSRKTTSIIQSCDYKQAEKRTIPVDVLPAPTPGTTSAEEKAAKDGRAAGRTDPSLLTVCEAIRENIGRRKLMGILIER